MAAVAAEADGADNGSWTTEPSREADESSIGSWTTEPSRTSWGRARGGGARDEAGDGGAAAAAPRAEAAVAVWHAGGCTSLASSRQKGFGRGVFHNNWF